MGKKKRIRLSWLASTTKSGGIKAIGQAEHQGRTLYSDEARAALRHQERGGMAPEEGASGAPPEVDRQSHLAKLLEEQKARDAASEFLDRMVKFVDQKFLDEEQAKTKAKEAKKASEALASRSLFHQSERDLPTNLRHAHETPEALMGAAKEAKPIFDQVLDTGKGVDKVLGATAVHAGSGTDFKEALEKPGPVVIIGGLKGLKRAKEKVDADYGGDWSKLHDVIRGTVGVESHADIPHAIEAIRTELANRGWSLAKQPKNKFETPTDAGYRDINLVFQTSGGLTGEIQVNTKAMLKAKEAAHPLYEKGRSIRAAAQSEGRDLTKEETAEYTSLAEQQTHIYDTAWQVSLGLANDSDLSSVLRHARHPSPEAGGEQAGRKDEAGRELGDVQRPGAVRDAGAPGGESGVREAGGAVQGAEPASQARMTVPHVLGESTDIDAAGYDKPIPAHFAVVDLEHLKPSHSYARGTPSPREGYPANLQPRDYAPGSAEDLKVRDMAQKMQTRYHLADVPDASNGSPAVTPDGTVLNGNGRAMSLELAAHQGRFNEYKSALEKKAGQFGIDPAKLRAMKNPVLVRVVNMDPHSAEAKKFASAGNVAATASQTPVRTAASLSRVIDNDLLDSLRLNEDTTFSEAVSHPTSGKAFRNASGTRCSTANSSGRS